MGRRDLEPLTRGTRLAESQGMTTSRILTLFLFAAFATSCASDGNNAQSCNDGKCDGAGGGDPFKDLGDIATRNFEYIVVGSGAGGGPLAANLARQGHSVLL